MTTDVQAPAGASERAPAVSGGYRGWVLFLLVVVYTSNFIDRTIINILGQSIKADLGLADWQLGTLSGLSFALLYSTLGIPIARFSERRNRVNIIAVSLAVWSGFTALCGGAQNFWQLFAARVGVGVGEAGCSPPAQSLLSDYFPPERRATALAIYSLGIPLGSLFGAVAGGWIAQTFGWRQAFVIVGLPGILLAVVLKLTVREPKRGGLDAVPATGTDTPSFGAVLTRLFGKKAFAHLAFGAALSSFAGYGIATFAVPFLLRGFELDLVQAATAYGIVGAGAAAVGVAAGGFVTDWAGKRDPRMYAWIPAAGFIIATPFYAAAFMQRDLLVMAVLIVIPAVLQYLYLGPTFAVTHNMVEPRMRATATAILFLIINLIGLGGGPTFIGWLSDVFAGQAFGGAAAFAATCPGGLPPAGASADVAGRCGSASFAGVRSALVAGSLVYLWAGLHYLLAGRSLRRDLGQGA